MLMKRGRGQHVTAVAQERPLRRIGRKSPAGERAGRGQASRGEPVRHRFAQVRPEQRGELPGSHPGRIQPDDARADRLAVQPPEHPRAVVTPVVAHRRQRFGKFHLHDQGRREPVTQIRPGPVVGRHGRRRAHLTSSRRSAGGLTVVLLHYVAEPRVGLAPGLPLPGRCLPRVVPRLGGQVPRLVDGLAQPGGEIGLVKGDDEAGAGEQRPEPGELGVVVRATWSGRRRARPGRGRTPPRDSCPSR